MVTDLVATAAAVPASASASASANRVSTILGIVVAIVLGLLALAFVFTLVLLVIMFCLSRLGGESAPRTRRLLSRMALARGGSNVHRGDDRPDPVALASGLAALRARDPGFDQIAIVESAHRALFFAFVMQTTGERERLEQVTTDDFWRSTLGAGLQSQGRAQERIRAMRESRQPVPDAASGGRPRTPGATISLDFHAGACTIQAVQPEEQGQDRVTVRLGYVGRSVVTGSAADLQIAARNKSLWQMAWGAGGLSTAGATPGGLAQSEQRGWYDLEFVRPVGLTTTLGGGGRRCHACGAPYHSDLDTACPNCRQIRVTPEGEWLLARSWLVVA